MIAEVTMYRVECDVEDCDASAQDDAEFYAYTDPQQALDDMNSTGDWYATDDKHLCNEHLPQCKNPDCGVFLHDDEFGDWCEDCAPVEAAS